MNSTIVLFVSLPLVPVFIYTVAWISATRGSSGTSRQVLERLLCRKHHGGFAQLARRIRDKSATSHRIVQGRLLSSEPHFVEQNPDSDILGRLLMLKSHQRTEAR